MSDIFISYSSEDRPKAQLLAGVLEAEGWSVFFHGKTFDEDSIKVALWSRAVQSNWVKTEDGLTRDAGSSTD